jgi:hypothetical protein
LGIEFHINMRLASAYSLLEDSTDAASTSVAAVIEKWGAAPDLLLIYATENHATDALIASVRAACPGTPILGSTSCGGVMTEAGFHSGEAGAMGVLGVSDPGGAYGVGSAALADDPFLGGALAIQEALAASGRDFESPVIVWCCQPPGREEAVLAGIQSVIGRHTPIIGGSSADEQIAGKWREFSTEGVLTDHVVVAVWFPTITHGAAFQSGYAPTERSGTVTRAEGRQVLEIDGLSASEVYSGWTNGDVPASQTGMILAQSTPTPLGRLAGEVDGSTASMQALADATGNYRGAVVQTLSLDIRPVHRGRGTAHGGGGALQGRPRARAVGRVAQASCKPLTVCARRPAPPFSDAVAALRVALLPVRGRRDPRWRPRVLCRRCGHPR